MPVVPHPLFEVPDPDALLWRYLDLPKYLSLIVSRSLWFARADDLGDPYEGSVPKGTIAERERTIGEIDAPEEARANMLHHIEQTSREMPKHIYINCWHRNNHESAAMWRLYSFGHSIAIVSSYRRMCDAIGGDDDISVGPVRYVDYETASIGEGNILWKFLHKRESFEHEHEVRAITVKFPYAKDADGIDLALPSPIGLSIPVAPELLVSELRISPEAPPWFAEIVRQLTTRYDLHYPVEQSALDSPPVH